MSRVVRAAIIAVVVLPALPYILGFLLPATTQARASVMLHAPPAAVFAVVADVEHMPAWVASMTALAAVAADDGRPTWEEQRTDGETVRYALVSAHAPSTTVAGRVELSARSVDGRFGANWITSISAAAGGTRVDVEQETFMHGALARFFLLVSGGSRAAAQGYVDALAAAPGVRG